ncbi:MAG: flagellar basal body-associated FliL family protein [Desulfarculaceae bacterium]|nr:flagellar basal body-associated FliL family protein [Desulfarculaceae bacterium]
MEKRFLRTIPFIAVVFAGLFLLQGCADQKKVDAKLMGGWIQKRGNTYIRLSLKSQNRWSASVKIADVTTRIIEVKGKASGNWHLDDDSLVMTVVESNISDIFEKNKTSFYKIEELTDNTMKLKNSVGRVVTWRSASSDTQEGSAEGVAQEIEMEPIAVNLNKIRSHDKDRYLCLNLKIELKELLPGTVIPDIHPRAREAVILYLSSLVYNDVRNLDKVKNLQKRLKKILTPYLDGFVGKVKIDHVIISSTMDRVEEFIIEHTLGESAAEGDSSKSKQTNGQEGE